MICVSLAGPTVERCLEGMAEAKRLGADLVEIRGDLLDSPGDLLDLLPKKTLPVLVTVRPHWEGGRWTAPEEDRVRLLRAACSEGAEYVDVEFRAYKDFPRGGAKLVVSWHDSEPGKMERVAEKMKGLDPFLLKIAVGARGTADLLRCVRLQKTIGVPSAVIAMGEFGEPLRILYRKYGGFLTYASPEPGSGTAPGQVPVAELTGLYAAGGVDDETEVYAVVGNPVAHSRGPALFNPAFRAIGRNARYVRIPLDDASLLREVVEAMELRGVSVTIPHKEAVEVDERDEAAREIGAVNTVLVRDGRLVGYNTDGPAVLEAVGDVRGRRALVLGAGGAGRAVAWALRRGGAEVAVANRTPGRGGATVPWAERGRVPADLVANATSVGMNSDESPFPGEAWKKGMRAFDAVYTPRETRFLREARAAGAETTDGEEMFRRQAALQFRLFTGRDLP
jgi:3-dehydroquinate dehydratase/shikimate dehydrogenase